MGEKKEKKKKDKEKKDKEKKKEKATVRSAPDGSDNNLPAHIGKMVCSDMKLETGESDLLSHCNQKSHFWQ